MVAEGSAAGAASSSGVAAELAVAEAASAGACTCTDTTGLRPATSTSGRSFKYVLYSGFSLRVSGDSDQEKINDIFQDFNASKFVVFSSLLVFSILYALKLDGILEGWSWWSVFAPLWAWKCIVGELSENC